MFIPPLTKEKEIKYNIAQINVISRYTKEHRNKLQKHTLILLTKEENMILDLT